MADVHVRLAAVKAVEDAAKDEDPNFQDAESSGASTHNAHMSHWLNRAESAIQRRKTLKRINTEMQP